jgi:hypothetical protein
MIISQASRRITDRREKRVRALSFQLIWPRLNKMHAIVGLQVPCLLVAEGEGHPVLVDQVLEMEKMREVAITDNLGFHFES